MEKILRFEDFNYNNKTVAIRVDLNLPYDAKTKTISETPRLKDHAKTLQELIKRGAKVIVLAHQGRKGDEDFISLDLHAKLLEKNLGKPVKFLKLDSSFDEIKNLKPGEIILLDNVRIFDDETKELTPVEHSNSALPKKLSPYLDYFILDAFSVSHRSHASVTGFCLAVPCIAGPVFLKEYDFLQKFVKELQISKNGVFVLGGAKPDEPINLMDRLYGKGVEKILTTGVISLLLLSARGYKLGKTEEFLIQKGYTKYLEKLSKYAKEKNIFTPIDYAVERGGNRVEVGLSELPISEPLLDIGSKTIEEYRRILSESRIVCMKGPAGTYEKSGFEKGTKDLFEIIARCECISLIGGGNSTDAMEKLKIPSEAYTYVSLSGGAFFEFFTGVDLPGVKALEISSGKFGK
jgi:phosphoglycerate kinase